MNYIDLNTEYLTSLEPNASDEEEAFDIQDEVARRFGVVEIVEMIVHKSTNELKKDQRELAKRKDDMDAFASMFIKQELATRRKK